MSGQGTTLPGDSGSLFDARIGDALEALAGCLNDHEPWDNSRLVELMETVFVALGGRIEEGEARV